MSDAVAVQVMVVPITCGDAGDGVRDRIATVAEAGMDNAASSPITYKELTLGIFMELTQVSQGACPRNAPLRKHSM